MTNEKHTNEEAIKILEEAIEVINQQKKEIVTLRNYNRELFVEIRKLNSIIVSNDIVENQRKIKREAKIEAYKEFAEKLKEEALPKCDWDDCVDVEDIDNLLKELAGEEE